MKRLTVLALLLAAGCGKDGGPQSGELALTLEGATLPRAVILEVVGPQNGVVPVGPPVQTTHLAAAGDTTRLFIAAPAGATLSGAVARLQVEDVRRTELYTARVIEAAGGNYALIAPSQITLTVTNTQ